MSSDAIRGDNFGARLRAIRKKSGLSQKEFGERIGASLPTVHRLEQRERYPHDEILMALMREFGADPRYLLTGEGKEVECREVCVIKSFPAQGEPEEIIGRFFLADFPQEARAIRIDCEDMFPTIRPGDYVIFIPGFPRDGGICLYRNTWGGVCARRYSEKHGGVLISEIHDVQAVPAAQVEIKGTVVQVVRHIVFETT